MATNNALNNASTSGFSSTGGAFTANSGTSAISISTDASATTINIGTGGAVKTTTLGSTNSTSATVISSGTGSIVCNTGFSVTSGGLNKNTKQSMFNAYQSASTSNDKTGDATVYQVIFNTEVSDQNSDYNNSTGVFTAPVTGKYLFESAIIFTNVVAQTTMQIQIQTTGATYNGSYESGAGVVASGAFLGGNMAVIAPMTAGDTAFVNAIGSGSTKKVGVIGGIGFTYFGGVLLC